MIQWMRSLTAAVHLADLRWRGAVHINLLDECLDNSGVASSRDSGSIVTDCDAVGRIEIFYVFVWRDCVALNHEVGPDRSVGHCRRSGRNPGYRRSQSRSQTRLLVKPANQPSRDVPVFPAAGSVKPRARTPAAVPLFMHVFHQTGDEIRDARVKNVFLFAASTFSRELHHWR